MSAVRWLLVALVLLGLALAGCGSADRVKVPAHDKRIEGSWTSHDPGFHTVSLQLRPDGTFQYEAGLNGPDPKKPGLDMTMMGGYGGTSTLKFVVMGYFSMNSRKRGNGVPRELLNQFPLMGGGVVTWNSPTEFVVTDAVTGRKSTLDRQ